MNIKRFGENTKVLWKDRKRWCGMPLSFTRYYLIEKENTWLKLFTSIGLLSTVDEEVNVFRIFDISVYQSLFDKLFNVGTITLYVNDESTDKLYIRKVKNPFKVRDLIASHIEKERLKRGFRVTEFHGVDF